MIALGVRGGSIQTARAVYLRIDEESAFEDSVSGCGLGIDPLVQVAV